MSEFLDAAALERAFASTPWRRLLVVEATGSTNADVAALARAGEASGLVEVTPHQQAGRGRFERVWLTPPNTCVAQSVLVRPRRPLAEWGWLSLLVGVAVSDGIRAATGLDASVKWPNDVLIGERKVCGILSEAVPTPDGLAAVLGYGLNIALAPEQLPVPTATSVRIEGSDAPAHAVVAAVLAALGALFGRWDAGEDIAEDYRARCSTLGQRVRVMLPDGIVEGRAVDVDAAGSLIVETSAGRRAFSAGDVVHLRRDLSGPTGT